MKAQVGNLCYHSSYQKDCVICMCNIFCFIIFFVFLILYNFFLCMWLILYNDHCIICTLYYVRCLSREGGRRRCQVAPVTFFPLSPLLLKKKIKRFLLLHLLVIIILVRYDITVFGNCSGLWRSKIDRRLKGIIKNVGLQNSVNLFFHPLPPQIERIRLLQSQLTYFRKRAIK